MVFMTTTINERNASSVSTQLKTEAKTERAIKALARLISGKYREIMDEMHRASKN